MPFCEVYFSCSCGAKETLKILCNSLWLFFCGAKFITDFGFAG
jgi:hypothetical protein